MKSFKDKLNNDTFRTTNSTTNWIQIIVELLPYIVAMAGIVTLMIMIDTIAKIIK